MNEALVCQRIFKRTVSDSFASLRKKIETLVKSCMLAIFVSLALLKPDRNIKLRSKFNHFHLSTVVKCEITKKFT